VVGPVPVSVQFVGTAVAPVVPLSTVLMRVSLGGMAVFVIVQVAFCPSARVTDVAVVVLPPVQTQPLASVPTERSPD